MVNATSVQNLVPGSLAVAVVWISTYACHVPRLWLKVTAGLNTFSACIREFYRLLKRIAPWRSESGWKLDLISLLTLSDLLRNKLDLCEHWRLINY